MNAIEVTSLVLSPICLIQNGSFDIFHLAVTPNLLSLAPARNRSSTLSKILTLKSQRTLLTSFNSLFIFIAWSTMVTFFFQDFFQTLIPSSWFTTISVTLVTLLLVSLSLTWLIRLVWSSSAPCCFNFLFRSSVSTWDSLLVLKIILTWSTKPYSWKPNIQDLSSIDPSFYGILPITLLSDFFLFRPFLSSNIMMMIWPMLLSHRALDGRENFTVVSSNLLHGIIYRNV